MDPSSINAELPLGIRHAVFLYERAFAASAPLRRSAYAWIALSSAGFALMNVLARLASGHAGWAQMAAVRAMIGVGLAISLARARGANLKIQHPLFAWGRSLFGTGSMVLTFYALGSRGIEVGDVGTLTSTSPIFIAILAPILLGEKSSPFVWGCAATAFAGVIIVSQPGFGTPPGLVLVTLGAALCGATAMIFLRRIGDRESPEATVMHFSLVATILPSTIAMFTWRSPGIAGWLLMIGAGLAGGCAQLAQARAYAMERAARVSVFSYVGIVFTQLLSVALLDERLELHQVFGSTLVIAAGAALMLRRR